MAQLNMTFFGTHLGKQGSSQPAWIVHWSRWRRWSWVVVAEEVEVEVAVMGGGHIKKRRPPTLVGFVGCCAKDDDDDEEKLVVQCVIPSQPTYPTLTQVPPRGPRSTTATLAPQAAARRADAMPPLPAPIT